MLVTRSIVIKPAYAYQSLGSPTPCFRLLRLDATHTSWSSPVQGSLEIHEVTDGEHPEYTTLSYTWGKPIMDRPILVDGATLMVTQSLYEALKQLREYQRNGTTSTDFWWIDQICINQEDMQERGHQVAVMKDIYQKASLTVAWMGPAADQSYVAMKALQAHTRDGATRQPVRKLFSRPYWKRGWIIQELCVSRAILLACGERTIPWPEGQSFFDGKLGTGYYFSTTIHRLRRAYQNSEHYNLALGYFIVETRPFDFTDVRDQVYGVLGLPAHGCHAKIVPDYTLSDCSVFCAAVRVMYEDWLGTRREKTASDQWQEKIVRCEHNPLLEDNEIRRECWGYGCGVLSLYEAISLEYWRS